jgi:hypothetical protein
VALVDRSPGRTKVDGVQPPDPPNPQAQPTPATPLQAAAPAPPSAGPRNRRARLVLAMAAGILALLCLGGVGVFISLYDDATEIKRTEPDAVVDSFLGAYLVNRDDSEADLYLCKTGPNLSTLATYRTTMTNIERDKSVGIRVSWSSLTVVDAGTGRTVTTDITQTATDGARLEDTWSFTLVDQDGWRVCSAARVK